MADELRVTQQGAEAIIVDEAEARVTQQGAEVAILLEPSALQVTQNAAEPVVLFNPAPLRITAQCLDIIIKPNPEEEEPPTASNTLEQCDLLLEVFNDDRETVRWSCATRLDFSNPYLLMPERYAEQEIDVAEGAASLGTVSVLIADVPTEAGNQDTGFVTSKLAYQAVADVQGRRARLLRALGSQPDVELEVVIDGVAGTPRLDRSYAAVGFEIRDTREVERKIRCFDGSVEGTNALLPHGVITPYGYNAETDTYLLPAVTPLTGTFSQNASQFPNPSTGTVDLTGNPDADRTIPLAVYQALSGQVTEQGDQEPFFGTFEWERVRFPNIAVWWRPASSSDPWNVIDGAHLVMDIYRSFRRYTLGYHTTDVADGVRIEGLAFGDDRIAPVGVSPAPYSPPLAGAVLPSDGQSIELIVVTAGVASEDNPFHLEGLTAGQFAKNVYDGVYSARDENGQIVPTGIRYDEAALLQMIDPVRMRIMEPINDARDWLEKHIYAPTGWVPALDRFGRISPVSQEAPTDIFSLPLIYDHITEPSPDWDAGERIINIVRFTYPRDFIPDDPELIETLDGLADKSVVLEFQDPVSIARNGPQVLEIDGRAFRAIGDSQGEPVLTGGITAETAYQLAFERRDHVLNRYSLGAPTMVVNVRREFTPTLRAGSWVRTWLTWFPDYVTGERGLIALCQVTAIGDLDCVWRQVQMEQVIPLALYDAELEVRYVLLVDDDGAVFLDDDGAVLIEEV